MKKRLLSLLLSALLLLALLPAASADAAVAGEEELLELFAEKKAAQAEEFEFTCGKDLFQALLADNAARLSVLEVKGGIAEARIRVSEQSCLIRLSEVKYSDEPWAECATEEEAGQALRRLLREGSTGFSLLCGPVLAKELAGSAILRSYAALAGFEDLELTYYASGVIRVADPVPFETAWAPAEDTAQFDAAVEGFALQTADEFTIVFAPAFYERLTEDEEQFRCLHASSIMDRYSYAPGDIYGSVRYTRVSYISEPSVVCRSEAELREAIAHIGALEIPNFRLYLADEELREELFDTPLAYVHHMEAESGLTYQVEISHSDNFIHYTNAWFQSKAVPISTAEEAEDYLAAQARAGAEQISLYCTPELYEELVGEEGAYLNAPDCLDAVYAMIARAGIDYADLSLNRPCGAIRIQIRGYAPALELLQAVENGAEEQLSEEQRACLEAARALAESLRSEDPAETSTRIRLALAGVPVLPDGGAEGKADTAYGALLGGGASPAGLADAYYLLGSLAGLELRYPTLGQGAAEGHYLALLRVEEQWAFVPLWEEQPPAE